MSPWSALPPHIDEAHEWDGYDDDQHWYTKWRKAVKGWFAFGPRATERWARFREWPITIFALFGKGLARFENDYLAIKAPAKPIFWYDSSGNKFYLSRVQYWCSWHVQLAWPLFFCFHLTIFGQMWMGYIGFKRDADGVYWLALFFGKGSK